MDDVNRLKIVDAFDLDDELRTILRPGEMVKDSQGRRHRLPRYFYEVPSHEMAMQVRISTHFGINEFVLVDLKEASQLQNFPRYIPCAVRIMAFYLEQFRVAAGASVHIVVNGGYRSPTHKLSTFASPHMWGTSADIYKVGTTILKSKETIEKYNALAEEVSDDIFVLPYGHQTGETVDDHVHLDLGFMTVVPREISEDRMEVPQERPRFAFEERRRRERRASDERAEATVPEE